MISKYQILYNPTILSLKQAALEHPKAFIFSFCTTSADKVKDYSSVFSDDAIYEKWMDRVGAPLYIGNISKENQQKIVEQMIRIYCPDGEEV